MNYRHAFHAGNFADVMKHALLLRILVHLQHKPTAFRVIDTHAGPGLYDLGGPEAERTGEASHGVGRLDDAFSPDIEELIAPYRRVLDATRVRHGRQAYPGSPAILREMLRPQDRAILIEKHPVDGADLTTRFNTVANLKVLTGDGWAALAGLLPPKERRGLVFIDPPYEGAGELARSVERLAALHRRWPTGIAALWYPIKDEGAIERLYDELTRAIPAPLVRLELTVEPPEDAQRLAGSGLVVLNPPWRLPTEASLLLPALADRLGRAKAGWRVEAQPASPPSTRPVPAG